MFDKWYCSYCKEKHSKKIPIAFHYQGFWEHAKKDYCSKFIMESDEDYKYNKKLINKLTWGKLDISKQMKIARDILNGYGFRRSSNGESIYTEITNVLRIENDIIYARVYDEYGNLMDFSIDFLLERISKSL